MKNTVSLFICISLSKKYLELGDLGKIDAIEVQGELDSEEEEESKYEDEEIDEKVTYTLSA